MGENLRGSRVAIKVNYFGETNASSRFPIFNFVSSTRTVFMIAAGRREDDLRGAGKPRRNLMVILRILQRNIALCMQ